MSGTVWRFSALIFNHVCREIWKVTVEIHLLTAISEPFFTKHTLAQQHFVNNFYTEFLENPAVVADAGSQTDLRRANAV
jgi:hypothetical protein